MTDDCNGCDLCAAYRRIDELNRLVAYWQRMAYELANGDRQEVIEPGKVWDGEVRSAVS